MHYCKSVTAVHLRANSFVPATGFYLCWQLAFLDTKLRDWAMLESNRRAVGCSDALSVWDTTQGQRLTDCWLAAYLYEIGRIGDATKSFRRCLANPEARSIAWPTLKHVPLRSEPKLTAGREIDQDSRSCCQHKAMYKLPVASLWPRGRSCVFTSTAFGEAAVRGGCQWALPQTMDVPFGVKPWAHKIKQYVWQNHGRWGVVVPRML
jgi:hypothetical protein